MILPVDYWEKLKWRISEQDADMDIYEILIFFSIHFYSVLLLAWYKQVWVFPKVCLPQICPSLLFLKIFFTIFSCPLFELHF